MANLPGLNYALSIRSFRENDQARLDYQTIIHCLVYYGHSFAVHGGKLYISDSAYSRLVQSGRVLPQQVTEEQNG